MKKDVVNDVSNMHVLIENIMINTVLLDFWRCMYTVARVCCASLFSCNYGITLMLTEVLANEMPYRFASSIGISRFES